jgi:hypothetical protein
MTEALFCPEQSQEPARKEAEKPETQRAPGVSPGSNRATVFAWI